MIKNVINNRKVLFELNFSPWLGIYIQPIFDVNPINRLSSCKTLIYPAIWDDENRIFPAENTDFIFTGLKPYNFWQKFMEKTLFLAVWHIFAYNK